MSAAYTSPLPTSTIFTTPATSPQATIYQSFDATDVLPSNLPLSASSKSSAVTGSLPTIVAPADAVHERPTQTIRVDTAAFPNPRRAVIMVTPLPVSQEYYIQLQIQSPTPRQVHVAIGIGAGAGAMMLALLAWVAFVHWRMKHVLRRLNHCDPRETGHLHQTVSPYDRQIRPSSYFPTSIRGLVANAVLHSDTHLHTSLTSDPTQSAVECGPPPSYPARSAMIEGDHMWGPTPTTMDFGWDPASLMTKPARSSLRITIPATPTPLAVRDVSSSARSSIISPVPGTQPPAYTCHIPLQ